MSLEDHQNCNL